MIETAAERQALAGVWGDCAYIGAEQIPGLYESPQAEDLLVEGIAPTFESTAASLAAASVAVNTIIDRIETHDGRTVGPYRVRRWASQDDGAFVVLGLEQQ